MIVSPAEHNAIIKLYEKYDKSSALINTIQHSIHTLNESEQFIIAEITKQMDEIIKNIRNKKQPSMQQTDTLYKQKENILKQQLNEMENYLKIINDGKYKYNSI